MSLNDVAILHNLVTVVDAASVFEQLGTMDTLVDRGWQADKGDQRTVAHLLVEQLEFANLLLINKRDLVTEAQLGAVEVFLRKVRPDGYKTAESDPSLPLLNLSLISRDLRTPRSTRRRRSCARSIACSSRRRCSARRDSA